MFLKLPAALVGEEIVFDYASSGPTCDAIFWRCCGLVALHQQPQTAKGVIFVSLEDKIGVAQVIVCRQVRERQRAALLHAKLLAVQGRWQREGDVGNVIAARLADLTPLLGRLAEVTSRGRNFH